MGQQSLQMKMAQMVMNMGHQVEMHLIHSVLGHQVVPGKELREANQEGMVHQEALADQERRVAV